MCTHARSNLVTIINKIANRHSLSLTYAGIHSSCKKLHSKLILLFIIIVFSNEDYFSVSFVLYKWSDSPEQLHALNIFNLKNFPELPQAGRELPVPNLEQTKYLAFEIWYFVTTTFILQSTISKVTYRHTKSVNYCFGSFGLPHP